MSSFCVSIGAGDGTDSAAVEDLTRPGEGTTAGSCSPGKDSISLSPAIGGDLIPAAGGGDIHVSSSSTEYFISSSAKKLNSSSTAVGKGFTSSSAVGKIFFPTSNSVASNDSTFSSAATSSVSGVDVLACSGVCCLPFFTVRCTW